MGAHPADPSAQHRAAARAQQQRQQRQHRLRELTQITALQGVPESELDHLLDLCVLRAYPPHTPIVRERERSAWLFFLLTGTVHLTATARDGHTLLLDVLQRGDCFGEGVLFGNAYQRIGVQSISPALVLQLELTELRDLLPALPRLDARLRAIHTRRLTLTTLARVPLFSQLDLPERESLAALLEQRHITRDTAIITQDTPGDAFYLIENGQTVVEHDGIVIATLGQGDFFGEMSLLTQQPHNATVRAVTLTDVLVLPASAFHALLHQRPDLESRLQAMVAQRRASMGRSLDHENRTRQLVSTIQHGILRSRYALVRTPELCPPNCTICEQACHMRHGNTRLHLNGVQIEQYDVVDVCRQCEIGAECVAACPETAIVWNDQGALIITDACTGCGACITACPYNAVDSVRLRPKKTTHPVIQFIDSAQQRLAPIIPLQPVRPTHRADKCDYCHGYGDMACISACPTGSLQLVPVEQIMPLG
jgi:CRP-like cAMP-binding protein/NAD-dependent dihydropyrimidine dehydrogenase PreA subunit